MNRTMARARKFPLIVFLLFCLVNFIFLIGFADRNGYEGDDLNSILPMAHLDAAKQGALLIYRYAWQPLSYEIGSLTWSMFGTPTAVFLLAPIAGAITLGLLFWWLWREGRTPNAALFALIAMMGIPELWYSALYYNSTIVGMPLLALALILARQCHGALSAFASGVLVGIAILLRMDFILICPLLAVAAWPKQQGLLRPIIVAVGVIAALLAGWLAGWLDLPAILQIQQASTAEIQQKANTPGWDIKFRLFVATVALGPVGWLLLLAGAPLLLLLAAGHRDLRALAWTAAALPAAYPLLTMMSPKYLLPVSPFLLLLFVHALAAVESWATGRTRTLGVTALSALAFLPVLISISLFGHAPFLVPGLSPARPVLTHDGPRGYGGYVWQMIATDAQTAAPQEQRAAEALATQLLDTRGANLLYLGGENYFEPGGVGWRHLQLIMEQRGIHGKLTGPRTLRFDLPGGRWLILARAVPQGLEGQPYRLIDQRTPADEGA